MSATQILARHGLRLVDNSGSGDEPSTDRAIPRTQARAIVAELRAAGATASDAPDNDDASLSWIYVTVEA